MKKFENPILVTRPYFPPIESFKAGLEEIWRNQWLTNNGPMVRLFQSGLSDYLGVSDSNMALFVNGTLALELGFQAMGLAGGEVITTPFTFVATSHALVRVGAKPVFADINPETLCLDPAKVEPLIKPGITRAIVPVHVYGHVCDIEGFDRLSKKYGVPVIYDAAHAFGITRGKKSIGACGAMSMFSFHPTKLFHSCEGGLLVFKDAALQNRLFELRNFAIHSETECTDVGSNAKMNELQALMGLCCLKKMPELLAYRKAIYDAYAEVFNSHGEHGEASCVADIQSSTRSTCSTRLKFLPYSANHAYIPVLFDSFATREKVYNELREKCNVFSRRYFYPLLTDFAPYAYAKGTCPVAEDIASRVLTLPTYYELPLEDVKDIAKNVLEIVAEKGDVA